MQNDDWWAGSFPWSYLSSAPVPPGINVVSERRPHVKHRGSKGGGGAGAVICFICAVVFFAPSLDNLIIFAVVVFVVGGRDGVLLGDRSREIDRDSNVFLNGLVGNGGSAFPSWASVSSRLSIFIPFCQQ